MTELGPKILELGKKAKYLQTGPWDEKQFIECSATRSKAFNPCIGKPNNKMFKTG